MKRSGNAEAASGREHRQLALFDDEREDPSLPADYASRRRFINSVEENFSVIAPAGVGKTQSIVERIAEIARHEKAAEWLPRLVVVTFTKRAADEMQQRAREQILSARLSLDLLEQFNRAFFGTIHSFCVELLRNFGHHIGLTAKFELVEKDDELWLDFLQESVALGGLEEAHREQFERHTPLQKILGLGRRLSAIADPARLPDCAKLGFDELLAHPPCPQSRGRVEVGQELVREWQELFCGDETYLPLPRYKLGGSKFQEVWQETFSPLREWLCSCALRVAAETARQYRQFRIMRGMLTYDDQVALASELLRVPAAARQIRERGYRVILDEAQDTDVAQFHVLLECARPLEADSDWQKSRSDPPEPGRFSMVGDPQQSIYSQRADLARYASIRGLLGRAPAGTELPFTTTFRCDGAIISFVNETFPRVFAPSEGQVTFVPLKARPNAGSGQVVRFTFEIPEPPDPKLPDRKRAINEAEALANWIAENGLEKLRARSWSEVAILVPQKRWFSPLRIALRNTGIRTQVQSPRDIKGDSPAYAWLTALLMIAANPRNHFEIFGVLREVFGVSDDELAHFSRGRDYALRIDRESDGSGAVVDALNFLTNTRRDIFKKPLRDAVADLISATKLRGRLASLPREFFETAAPELDDLLALASSAEAEGQTLSAFAENLRQNFYALREPRPAQTDAIQLLTCHKAKGLQWDAVILPFFHRRPYPARSLFPRLIHRGSELPAIVALESEDLTEETRELVELRERQETERLLYVSLTRARHTLILADDATLFQRGGNVHRHSFAAALRIFEGEQHRTSWRSFPGPNHAAWQALGSELSASELPAGANEMQLGDVPVEIAPISAEQLSRATRRASEFPKRTLPSSFAGHRSDEKWRLDREPAWRDPAPGTGAIAYGKWWHELMQALPSRESDARTRIFADALPHSPDKKRSTREWELFNTSDLANQIFSGEFMAHAEMPMLWRKSAGECVEGVIDLAMFAPDSSEWLIIDWKTDLVGSGAAELLREAYGAQVVAYVEAIAAITGQPARGGLYSSSAGVWLPL